MRQIVPPCRIYSLKFPGIFMFVIRRMNTNLFNMCLVLYFKLVLDQSRKVFLMNIQFLNNNSLLILYCTHMNMNKVQK